MGDERLARLPFLVGMVVAGEEERTGDPPAVDRYLRCGTFGLAFLFEGVDDGQQVLEQGLLTGVQPLNQLMLCDRLRNSIRSLCRLIAAENTGDEVNSTFPEDTTPGN